MNRGRHRKRHVKRILHVSRYSESWISDVLDDKTIDKILYYQSIHSNVRDITVFEKCYYAGESSKGFNWSNTLEGDNYWCNVMTKIDKYKRENMFRL